MANRALQPRPTYETYGRWADVLPTFAQEWDRLREVPVSRLILSRVTYYPRPILGRHQPFDARAACSGEYLR
jgi:hypothetical protein